MPTDDIEEIKRRIDIVDFISSYVPLKKAGANFKALCPFHQEKVPSFMVSPEKQIWHCFGCSRGGDVFAFLMEREGLEFGDALKILADRAGVQLKKISPKIQKQKSLLFEINTIAAKFYHHILKNTPAGKKALNYLKNRGIKDATINEFMLGYAPDKWELLYNFLINKKHYQVQDVASAGLIIPSEKKRAKTPFYDRFRDRIIFPIWNLSDQIVGFSGRTLKKDEEIAKYINSPDSPVYSKSRVIYGLNLARKDIKKKNQVIIVEGQMDLISLHQAGYKNTVATSGSAITIDHIETLKKFTENIVFAFDQDQAGEAAAKRAIQVAAQAGINPKLIITPTGKDPDECLRQNPQAWEKANQKPIPVLDFYFQKAFAGKEKLTSDEKRAIVRELLPVISYFADSITQGEYLQKLSQKILIPERYLWEAVKKFKIKKTFPQPAKTAEFQVIRAKTEREILGERILGLVLLKPKYLSVVFQNLNFLDFSPIAQDIVKALQNWYNKCRQVNLIALKKTLSKDSQALLDLILLKAETEFSHFEDKTIKDEILLSCRLLRKLRLENIKNLYEQKIKQAEKTGNKEKLKKIIRKFQKFIIEKS